MRRAAAAVLLFAGVLHAQIFGGGGSSSGAGGNGQYSVGSATYTVGGGPYFLPPGGGGPASATEASVRVGAPVAGSYSYFCVTLGTAPGTGNSLTFTWRLNGVDTALSVAIANGSVSV